MFLTRIPRLLSFLLHYSIYNGFSVDTSLHLAPSLLRFIKSSSNPSIKKTIEILEFKEDLCLHLLQPHEKECKSFNRLARDSVETAKICGILGFLLASISKSSQTSRDTNEIIAIAHSWREMEGWYPSTMLTFAENLLFAGEAMKQSLKRSYLLENADIQVRCTLAMAMVERSRITEACALLTACAKDFRSTESDYVDGYFPVMTELVKCHNILNQEEDGEVTALEALRHLYSDTATRIEICNIQIALADSLIGQSKYSEAEKLLEEVLASHMLSKYITAVASLRLSKVKRRLGILDVSAFTHNGAPLKALICASDSNSHIRDAFLEELSSTVSFTRQNATENLPEVKAVLETASIIVGGQSIYTSNWRTRILQEQVAHVSGLQTRDDDCYHRNITETSVNAHGSQKIPPLRVLILRERLGAEGPGVEVDLGSLHKSLNVGGHHGNSLYREWLLELTLGRCCSNINTDT